MADNGAPNDFIKSLTILKKALDEIKPYFEQVGNPALTKDALVHVQTMKTYVDFILHEGNRMATQVEQLRGLTETAAMLNSSLHADAVLEAVMDTLIRLIGAERAFLVLHEGGDLHVRAARNWDEQAVPQDDATFSRSIVRSVIDNREPILTTNAQFDTRFANAPSIATRSLRSVMCVPLISRGEVIGVLYADNRVLAGLFDQGTMALATAFAHQAAVAIDNAQRFEKVTQERDEAQRELEVLRIHIDHEQRQRHLQEITETDYFKRIQLLARQQRKAFGGAPDENVNP